MLRAVESGGMLHSPRRNSRRFSRWLIAVVHPCTLTLCPLTSAQSRVIFQTSTAHVIANQRKPRQKATNAHCRQPTVGRISSALLSELCSGGIPSAPVLIVSVDVMCCWSGERLVGRLSCQLSCHAFGAVLLPVSLQPFSSIMWSIIQSLWHSVTIVTSIVNSTIVNSIMLLLYQLIHVRYWLRSADKRSGDLNTSIESKHILSIQILY